MDLRDHLAHLEILALKEVLANLKQRLLLDPRDHPEHRVINNWIFFKDQFNFFTLNINHQDLPDPREKLEIQVVPDFPVDLGHKDQLGSTEHQEDLDRQENEA
jgi:hypothetical protein